MRLTLISVLPEILRGFLDQSILSRAQSAAVLKIEILGLRDFAKPPHYRVDERIFGGGPGMLLSCEPIVKALQSVDPERKAKRILLSAKGRPFSQETAESYSQLEHLILICGRYEGVDQRVADYYVDDEIRVGDFVTMGGEAPAVAVVEACARLLPGVLGNEESSQQESFSQKGGGLEEPHYTRPQEFEGHRVPDVLLTGNHEEVRKWRKQMKQTAN